MEQQTVVTRSSLLDPFDDVNTNTDVRRKFCFLFKSFSLFLRQPKRKSTIFQHLQIFAWIYHADYHITSRIITIVNYSLAEYVF